MTPKTPRTITIAMMTDPIVSSWEAQIHIEYHNTEGKDVLPLKGDSPMQLLERCREAVGRRLDKLNANRN